MPEKILKEEDSTSLTVIEAADLARMLEEKWGVPAAGTAQAAGEEVAFTVVLAAAGDRMAEVIEAVGAITGLNRGAAGDLVAQAPIVLREGITEREAGRDLGKLSSIGARVLLVRADPTGATATVRTDDPPGRYPVTDFRREAESIGVSVDPQPDRSDAAAIVRKIAGSARDLFPEEAEAQTFLFDHPIDGSGRTAVDLVQERGAAALLIKLDQMRFGANG